MAQQKFDYYIEKNEFLKDYICENYDGQINYYDITDKIQRSIVEVQKMVLKRPQQQEGTITFIDEFQQRIDNIKQMIKNETKDMQWIHNLFILHHDIEQFQKIIENQLKINENFVKLNYDLSKKIQEQDTKLLKKEAKIQDLKCKLEQQINQQKNLNNSNKFNKYHYSIMILILLILAFFYSKIQINEVRCQEQQYQINQQQQLLFIDQELKFEINKVVKSSMQGKMSLVILNTQFQNGINSFNLFSNINGIYFAGLLGVEQNKEFDFSNKVEWKIFGKMIDYSDLIRIQTDMFKYKITYKYKYSFQDEYVQLQRGLTYYPLIGLLQDNQMIQIVKDDDISFGTLAMTLKN